MRKLTIIMAAIAAAFVSFASAPASARCIQYPNQFGGIHTHCFVEMPQMAPAYGPQPYYVPRPRYVPRPFYRPRPRCGWDRWNRWHCR